MNNIIHTIRHAARAAAVLLIALLAAQTAGAQTNVSNAAGLAEAFGNTNVSVVNVTDNITGVGMLSLNHALTINLNGHTISGDGLFFNINDGSLTINGGDGSVGNIISGDANRPAIYNSKGKVTLSNVNITTNFNYAILGYDMLNIGDNVSFNGWTDGPFYTPYVNNMGNYNYDPGTPRANVVATVTVEGKTHYFENSGAALTYIVSHPDNDDFSLSGDTYTIHTATGWDLFCDCLNDNDTHNRFSGKTVRLGADITVSRMAGSSGHDFCGTFDGQEHTLTFNYGRDGSYASDEYAAPFHYVSNVGSTVAAFRNLHVVGRIYTSAKYAAGLIAQHWGTVNVENCRVSTVIHSSVSGDGTHGGIEAVNIGVLNITGTVFDGKLLTTNGTFNCGGFVGWHYGGTTNISNSLYAPAAIAASETEVGPGTAGQNPSATFGRNAVNSIANSYYTRTLGTAQGKQAHSITAGDGVTLAHAGVATEYSVSGITAYKSGNDFTSGILYNNVLYAGSGDAVSLTLANNLGVTPEGYEVVYTASAGTLSGTGNLYTLTMPDADVTASANIIVIPWDGDGSKGKPYLIKYASQLGLLAHRVNGTHGENLQSDGYENKFFQLANDISYPHKADGEDGADTESNFEAIGGYYGDDYRSFRGHFDGNNKTISGIRIYKGGKSDADRYQGIFGQTGTGADIHDLTLADARITGYDNTGGIVGYKEGGTVSNCHVTGDVAVCAVQKNAFYHGGIVGYNKGGTIEQCTSTATLTIANASNSKYYGGIAGINAYDGTLRDNLAIGATVPAATNNSYGAITGYYTSGTLQRNYYAACKVAGTPNATGVGCNNADVNNDNGAVPGYLLTLGDGITSSAWSITIPAHKELDDNGQLVTVAAVTYNVAVAGTTIGFNSGETEGYSASYSVNGSPVSGNSITMPAANVTVTSNGGEPIDLWGMAGGADGSSDHPYTITTTAGWNLLAGNVAAGKSYSGKHFQLGADGISISTMVGSSACHFSGHFNGNGNTLAVNMTSADEYTAPFRYVSGATITGLHTTGTVTTAHKCATGLVGRHNGDVTISNCRSSVAIVSSVSGDGIHGGFVATGSGTATIEGCLFDGVICTTASGLTNKCGGFVGWNGDMVNISNSLYAPTAVPEGRYAIGTDGCATFARNGAGITNSYYTQVLGSAQGKACHSVTAGTDVTVAHAGVATVYSVSGITAYKATGASTDSDPFIAGLLYNNNVVDVLYAGSGDEVSLTLSNTATGAPAGYQYGYTTNAGTLDGSTLTMPAANVTVSVNTAILTVLPWSGDGSEGSPYIIYNKDQLDLLAHRVNGTHGETRQEVGYEGVYFKLDKDITYTHKADGEEGAATESNYEAIGGYYDGNDRYFCGHFDGNNKTISGIRIYKDGTGYADYYQGIFGRTYGADIHDLTLADARITGCDNTGGIVGNNRGTVTRCHVAADVAVCAVQSDAWYHGGIAGINDAGTIEQCTSAVTLTIEANSQYYGGIAGENYGGTLHDNLAIGATVPAAASNFYGAITGYNGGTLQRNYYTACKVAGTENATGVGCNNADVTADNGAVSIHTLTLAEGITTATAATVTHAGTGYYAQGTAIALSYGGTIGDGYQLAIVSNDGNGSNAATADGNGHYTAVMPAANATAKVDFIDWAVAYEGSETDPYIIYNKDQLDLLAHRVNGTHGETANDYEGKYFKLGADIKFDHAENETDDYAENYEAIGSYHNDTDHYFNGIFDGDGHTVSGIRINKTGGDFSDYNQGLFGSIYYGANIHDVHLTDARITGCLYVGGIAGSVDGGTVTGCVVTDSYITASDDYGTICGFNSGTLTNNYYHGCTVNGTAVTSGVGYYGSDITDNNGALPAYRLALGANITTPPGTFVGQTEWLDTPPASARLAPENGFTLAGNHYFASGYEFTPGSTLASGAAQGYTPRATLGGELLDPYTPMGDADPLDGKAIARLSITADCDGKTLDLTLISTGQPVTVAYINADGTTGEASAIALDGHETVDSYGEVRLTAGTYYVGTDIAYANEIRPTGDITLILANGKTMTLNGNTTGIAGGNNLTIYGQSLDDATAGTLRYDGTVHGISVNNYEQHSGNVSITITGSGVRGIIAYVTLRGGTLTISADGDDACAIYGTTHSILGGQLTANATGTNTTGIYASANSGTAITLGWTRPADRITVSSISTGGGTVAVADGQALTDGSGNIYTGTLDPSVLSGFAAETTLQPCLALADAADNTAAIDAHADQTLAVALSGRTLYKDGSWNTLCLPFSVDLTASGTLSGDNVQAMTLNTETSSLAGSTLTLNFTAATGQTIPAGTPFIIKWDKPADYVAYDGQNAATCSDLVSPVFMGVTIDAEKHDATVTDVLTFAGTYAPVSIGSEGDNTKLYLGAANKLYYPTKAMTIGTHRAYFQLADGITAGEPVSSSNARQIRAFNLNFFDEQSGEAERGDDEATGIVSAEANSSLFTLHSSLSEWYTLDGRRLDGQPTAKGIYIHGGKKVAIK